LLIAYSDAEGLGKLDTSLKRHTALLTKLRSSLHTPAAVPGILKDIAGLSLEKYVEEAVGAVFEGLGKCKTGPETLGAIDVSGDEELFEGTQSNSRKSFGQIVSALHQRFPDLFTPPFTLLLLQALKPSSSTASDKDIREKEDNARVIRQRGLLRILGELEVVGVVRKDGGKGAVGDVSWGVLKELVSRAWPLAEQKEGGG
jgi:regulator of nonsense transcripts 2